MIRQPHTQSKTQPTGQVNAVARNEVRRAHGMLKIGVVRGGLIVDERIITQRNHVTVGSSANSTFVIASTAIPPNFCLFELIGSNYHLNFVESMSGHVKSSMGTVDLAAIKELLRSARKGAYRLKLSDDACGKLVIGDTTFLFQLVAESSIQPHSHLPSAVMRGAGTIDWRTTTIAAFSFLLHFLGIGSIYSDWLDPMISEDANLASLIDSIRTLPPPPAVEQQQSARDQSDKVSEEKEKKRTENARGSGKSAESAARMRARQAAALAKALDSLEMATLGVLSTQATATSGVLEGRRVSMGALDDAARTRAGVSSDMGDLRIAGAEVVRPGAFSEGFGSFGLNGRSEGTDAHGKVEKVGGPKVTTSIGATAVSGGAVANASRVIANMRATFRNCFNRELAQNPDAQGKIDLSINVGPGGDVKSVSAVVTGNLGSAVECVKRRATFGQFDPPAGGSAVIRVPVAFVKQ